MSPPFIMEPISEQDFNAAGKPYGITYDMMPQLVAQRDLLIKHLKTEGDLSDIIRAQKPKDSVADLEQAGACN